MNPRIKVEGYTTIGNLSAGYGTLAACVDLVAVELLGGLSDDGEISLKYTGPDKSLKRNPEYDLITEAIAAYLRHVDRADQGVSIAARKRLHSDRGLGTAAASVSAALVLINHLLKRPLSIRELLPIAIEVLPEGILRPSAHRLAAALLGGVQCVSNVASGNSLRIRADLGLHFTILSMSTAKTICVDYPMPAPTMMMHSEQLGYLAGLILGLERNNLPLIQDSLQDIYIEPSYKSEQPHFDALKELAMARGALGCSLSGHGPSMWALSQNSFIAEEIAAAWRGYADKNAVPAGVHVSGLQLDGARVC